MMWSEAQQHTAFISATNARPIFVITSPRKIEIAGLLIRAHPDGNGGAFLAVKFGRVMDPSKETRSDTFGTDRERHPGTRKKSIIDPTPYGAVRFSRRSRMEDIIVRKGAEEARNQLPDLLDAAEKGQSTIITRHGRPIAALVPVEAYGTAVRQHSLVPVAGSARGLWGKNSARTLRKLRDEWSR